ncbi:hypothetical protein AVEN_239146-1 [Araneus ventricosus]|uniref:Uncharacterized protein n=1 Tax=Araneus ventricosus TaxID=182803 RepID=A0A4Y2H8F2_ARAVE|nr:hypothetical protein AVEN_239146-1 [Araneus ventricosus]
MSIPLSLLLPICEDVSCSCRPNMNSQSEVPVKRRRVIEQKIVQQWPIDPFLSVNVNQRDDKVRVRIVDASGNTAVEMMSPTFYEFCRKMNDFNVVYTSNTIICNNQLAVFSSNGECILQQIYEKSGGGFTMKPQFLKMSREQLMDLLSKFHELNEYVVNTLLFDALPQSVRRNCNKVSTKLHSETFLNAVFDKVMIQVNNLYHCNGCVWDHPSQTRHECIMHSSLDKYRSEGERALFYLNFSNICSNVKEYNENVFTSLNVKMYKDYFEKLIVNV